MTDDVIDLTALRSLKDVVGDDIDLLAELVDVFKRTSPNLLAEMQSALASQDLASLRIAAHGCKSNARDMGALHLAKLCRGLEEQCRTGELENPEAQMAAVEIEMTRAIDALNALDLADV